MKTLNLQPKTIRIGSKTMDIALQYKLRSWDTQIIAMDKKMVDICYTAPANHQIRIELDKNCIYFLIGNDGIRPMIYVGQAGARSGASEGMTVLKRLHEHKVNKDEKYHDYWDTIIIFVPVSEDRWKATELDYLERIFVEKAWKNENKYGWKCYTQQVNYGEPREEDKIVCDEDYKQGVQYLYSQECKLFADEDETIPNIPDAETEKTIFTHDKNNIEVVELGLTEVVTPDHIVDQMLSLLDWNSFDLKTKFLDPACKVGEFLVAIRDRLHDLEMQRGYFSNYGDKASEACYKHIITNQLFGLATSLNSQYLTIFNLCDGIEVDTDPNIIWMQDYLDYIKADTVNSVDISDYIDIDYYRLNGYNISNQKEKESIIKEVTQVKEKDLHNKDKVKAEKARQRFEARKRLHYRSRLYKEFKQDMKIDVVIGNPPYQEDNSTNGKQTKPLYVRFVEAGITLSSKHLVFITNNTFLTNDSKKDVRDTMISAGLSSLYNYPISGEIFKGLGVSACIFKIDKNKQDKSFEYKRIEKGNIVNQYNGTINIGDIIAESNYEMTIPYKAKENKTMADIVLCDKIFGIASSGRKGFQGKEPFITPSNVASTNSIKLKNKFKDELEDFNGICYINENDVGEKGRKYINMYKVICPLIISKSSLNSFNKSEILDPGCVCTQNWSTLGAFENKESATNLQKYIQTKFFQFIAYVFASNGKTSISTVLMSHIPLQDFSSTSTIPWHVGGGSLTLPA